ncbi:MAG: SPFH domain-containing protein [Planctomycetota bacterium]
MPRSNASMGVVLFFGILLGVGLIVGPFFIPALSNPSKMILAGFGAALLMLFGITLVITRLYRKTAADEAFVRTGVGGRKCIIDGGAIVIPVVHEIIPVSLKTFKLEVDRKGPEALITADFLRADVTAVFYVRVLKEPVDIVQAATSLGVTSSNPAAVQQLIFEKLVSALRTVAATQNLYDLNAKRAEFAEAVQRIVEQDLRSNGLTLESVTISSLDQAPLDAMRPQENVFDAQGARTIAEQVQAQRVARNEIERDADQKVKQQNVKTAQYVAQQEVIEARAKAEAEAAKNIAVAENQQKAATVAAQQSRLAGVARVEAERDVKLATVEQSRAVQVADQEREQAAQVAGVARERAVELTRREQQIVIAEAEKRRAAAEAEQLTTEQARKVAEQAVLTIQVRATAEREKDKAVIAKQAEVEQQRIEQQMHAEVAAYTAVKKAEGEQVAAEKQADARITLAQATKQAKTLEAEAERAVQMVPVNVAQEQVKVSDAQVTVKIRDLEGQARFEKIARELQVELAKIAAERDARIAAAQAFGHALANAKMTLWGDPTAVQRMSTAFYQGQAVGMFADGLGKSLPPGLKEAAARGFAGFGATLAAAVKKITGVDLDPEAAEAALRESAQEPEATDARPRSDERETAKRGRNV